MKKKLALLFVILMTLSSTLLKAQMPEISTAGNDVWYYVLNQRGWTAGAPLDNVALMGTALGVQLTTNTPESENYAEQWKVVEITAGEYQMINRSTGLSISMNCTANNPADGVNWKLQLTSGLYGDIPGVRIISTVNDGSGYPVGLHASGGSVSNYDEEAPECFWVFKKPVDMVYKTPEVSTPGNDVWYYVLNQRGWTTGDPLTTAAMTGTALGVELKTSSPKYNAYNQQWKVIKNVDGFYQMVNRLTGLTIALNCYANQSSDNITWKFQLTSGTFPGVRIISSDGSAGIHASGGRVFPYNTEAAECFWYFEKSEDMTFKQPTTPIEFSDAITNVWYTIKTPGRADRNYLTDKGLNNTIMGTNLTANNDSLLWKVIDLGDGTVNLVSKLNAGSIQAPVANSVNVPLVAAPQVYTLDYLDLEQYNIVTNGGYQLHLAGGRNLVAYPAGLNSASAWIFEKVLQTYTGVNNANDSAIRIYSDNGLIQVVGTDLKPQIFTITGVKVDALKPQAKGIYVVKVANIIQKVMVD